MCVHKYRSWRDVGGHHSGELLSREPRLFLQVQFTALFVRFEHRAWRKPPLKPKSLQSFNWPFRPALPSRKTRLLDSQPDRGALSSRDDLSPAAWRPFPSSRSKNTVFRLVPPGSASEWSTGNPRTHFSGFSVFSRVFLRTLMCFSKTRGNTLKRRF